MSRIRKTIGISLFFVAFFASTTGAEIINVDPGTVDEEADNFFIGLTENGLLVDIVFTDNKTLEWVAGQHFFRLVGPTCVLYTGILVDAAGVEIPGTELIGETPCAAGSEIEIGIINLPDITVFSGIRLTMSCNACPGGFDWNWDTVDTPVVRQGLPTPVADAGGPYSTTIQTEATFNGRDSLPPEGGTITSYDWDFGDGGTATGVAPTHIYTDDGTYTVTLIVTADNGATDDDTAEATVASTNLAPDAVPGGPYGGSINNPVTVDASDSTDDSGGIARYDWAWGDGSNSADTPPVTTHTYAEEKVYYATLTVTDSDGLEDSEEVQVTIGAANLFPTAEPGGPYSGLVNAPVQFDGSDSTDPENDLLTYNWDWGDNTSSNDAGPMPTHTYTESCVCEVNLTVRDTAGGEGRNNTVAIITVNGDNETPVADANGPYQGVPDEPVIFDATDSTDADEDELQYDWDYGDDSPFDIDAGPSPSHTYTTAGVYAAVVVVSDGKFNGDDATFAAVNIVADNQDPIANAGVSYDGTTGIAVKFDGTLSEDLDGDIVQYDWDYGDGSPIDINVGATPAHVYAAAGEYTATLTVTDDDGATNANDAAVAIDQANELPVADAGDTYNGTTGNEVLFDGSNSTDDGSIVQYDWDYDDGSPVDVNAGATPVHVYAAEGEYTARLTVTDNDGASSSDEALVYIAVANEPPVADAGDSYVGTINVPVNFDGSLSTDDSGIALYEWDFDGDGVVDDNSGPNPSYTFTADGVYTASLRVTDDDGLPDTDSAEVLIDLPPQAPVANAGGPYTGAVDVAVEFFGGDSTDPDGNIVRYDWDFGDGSTAPNGGATPSHTYTTSAKFTVTLQVTDNEGTTGPTDTVTTSASIGEGNRAPVADAGDRYPGVIGIPVTFDGTGSTDPDGDPLTYSWDFGDNTPAGSGAKPTHTYTTAGVRNVILTVTDDEDVPASSDAPALIGSGTNPPTADAGGPYSSVELTIDFDGTSSSDPDGGNLRYAWDFGDGGIASGPTPSHTYASIGSYTVTLRVRDDTGRRAEDVTGADILVDAPNVVGQEQSAAESAIVAANLFVGTVTTEFSSTIPEGEVISQSPAACTACVAVASRVDLVVSSATANLSVNTKSKGSAFGLIELLMLTLFGVVLKAARGCRAGSGPMSAAVVMLGVLLAAPLPGRADDLSWYGALGVGSSSVDYSAGAFESGMASRGHTVANVSIDDSDTGYKIYGGFNWGRFFAAELGYVDLGEVTTSFDVMTDDPEQLAQDASDLLPVLSDGIALSAIGRYQFGDRFAMFGKVGAYFWESDDSINVTGDVEGSSNPSLDGTATLYGIGGDLYFPDFANGLFGVRLEWERYALDKNDVDLASVSVLLRF